MGARVSAIDYRRHLPAVHIETTAPEDGFVSGKGTDVFVDGLRWPILHYKVEGGANDTQRITLEFMGRVSFEHKVKPG